MTMSIHQQQATQQLHVASGPPSSPWQQYTSNCPAYYWLLSAWRVGRKRTAGPTQSVSITAQWWGDFFPKTTVNHCVLFPIDWQPWRMIVYPVSALDPIWWDITLASTPTSQCSTQFTVCFLNTKFKNDCSK